MQTEEERSVYEHLNTADIDDAYRDDDISQSSCLPFLRQLLICSTIWTIYFMYGLQMGTPTVMIPQLRKELSMEIDEDLGSWITSMFTIGALPWAFIIPLATNVVGKKGTFIFVNFVTFIGLLVITFASNIRQLLIGEFVLGILLGALHTAAPLVITEYTLPKYRGLFMTIKSASGFWGIWVSNCIGTFWHWRNILIVAFLCNAYSFLIWTWPESPYSLAAKGRYIECAKVHRWLKGNSLDASAELNQLISFHKNQLEQNFNKKSVSLKEFFCDALKTVSCKAFYKPLLIIMLIGLQYSLTGKLVCSMYAIEILKKITDNESMAYKGMLILDGVTVFGAYCGCLLSRYFKRRTFLLSTATFGIFFLYSLSLYLYMVRKSIMMENIYITVFLLSVFSITITSGPMILLTTVYGEIIPVKYQRSAMLCFGGVMSVLFAITIKFAPLFFRTLGLAGAFLFCAISSTVAVILLYIYLPETKDKTLHEIEEYFTGTTLTRNDCTFTSIK